MLTTDLSSLILVTIMRLPPVARGVVGHLGGRESPWRGPATSTGNEYRQRGLATSTGNEYRQRALGTGLLSAVSKNSRPVVFECIDEARGHRELITTTRDRTLTGGFEPTSARARTPIEGGDQS
jgi:hypothetical protein